MAGNASVFNLDNFTVTRRPVPNPGLDCNVPAINTSAASGTRITGTGFLQAANLNSGQDQVLVHSGDQCVKVDNRKFVWIGGDEEYVNHAKLDHQIMGEFTEKYHKTSKSEFVGEVNIDYYSHIKSKEHSGDTRYRNINETIIFTGNQTTIHNGNRTRNMTGTDVNVAKPLRCTVIMGLDEKVVTGIDTKQVVGIDLSYSLLKNSTSLIDSKLALCEMKVGCAAVAATAAKLDARGLLGRVGAVCLKGAAACIGMIRW